MNGEALQKQAGAGRGPSLPEQHACFIDKDHSAPPGGSPASEIRHRTSQADLLFGSQLFSGVGVYSFISGQRCKLLHEQ